MNGHHKPFGHIILIIDRLGVWCIHYFPSTCGYIDFIEPIGKIFGIRKSGGKVKLEN